MRARCAGPCRMAQILGEGYEVVAEGLSGRIPQCFSDYIEPYRAGIEQIVPIVQSHAPDALVVMLGTMIPRRAIMCAQEIGYGMEELLLRLRTAYPFHLRRRWCWYRPRRCAAKRAIEFSLSSVEKSKELAPIYAGIARRFGCGYFDAGGNLPSWVRTASISRRRD